MLRMNATSRDYEVGMSPEMKAFHDEYALVVDVEGIDGIERRFRLPTLSELKQYNIVVTTCVSGGMPFAAGVPKGYYDWIFIDEAGQASEPEGAHISISDKPAYIMRTYSRDPHPHSGRRSYQHRTMW